MTFGFKKKDGDDELNDAALANVLDTMNIDQDYNVFSSLRQSMSKPKAKDDNSKSNEKLEGIKEKDIPLDFKALMQALSADDAKWLSRLYRNEVFEHDYELAGSESRELYDLAMQYGMISQVGKKKTSVVKSLQMKLSKKKTYPHVELAKLALLGNDEDDPSSILLKRGPVIMMKGDQVLEEEDFADNLFEVSVLRDYILIASVTENDENGTLIRQLIDCIEVSEVDKILSHELVPVNGGAENIDPNDDENYNEVCFRINCRTKGLYTFVCTTVFQFEAWIETLAAIISKRQEEPGLEHSILRTSVHSAAYCGDHSMIARAVVLCIDINEKDSRGKTALHYAVLQQEVVCVKILVGSGADKEILDTNKRSPVNYAKDLQGPAAETIKMLLGIPSETKPSSPVMETDSLSNRMKDTSEELLKRGEHILEMIGQATNLNQEAQTFNQLAGDLEKAMEEQDKNFFKPWKKIQAGIFLTNSKK